jgi:hypothetical protein
MEACLAQCAAGAKTGDEAIRRDWEAEAEACQYCQHQVRCGEDSGTEVVPVAQQI